MGLVWLSSSSSVDTLSPYWLYSSSSSNSTSSSITMSDIYTHEPVMDFSNLFLDFDQGYTRPFVTAQTFKGTLVPIQLEEEESLLPEKPLTWKEQKTHRGYPRGESQGDSSGRILLPSFLSRMLKSLFQDLVWGSVCLGKG